MNVKPALKSAFKYKLGSESFKRAFKLYNSTLKNPPKGIDEDQTHIFKLLWESVHISTILDDVTHQATSISILDHSLVAMCTAYECYVKDCFAWSLVNFRNYGRKYVSTLSTPVKEMAKYEYDPLKNAGNIFSDKEGQAFKLFDNGKKLFRDVLEFDLFKDDKTEELLWKIFQTRHCIIHNGGKPDQLWRSKTKNSKFQKDAKTLRKYDRNVHNQFHELYVRLYSHFFKKKPVLVHEK